MSDEYTDLRGRLIATRERVNEVKAKLSVARDKVAKSEEDERDRA